MAPAGRRFPVRLHLLAAPAITQGNGDGTLGLMLANDVLVEFADNFLGRHGASPRVSMV